jgi:ribose/xylose/arabinose/galactoside ABC-type transport system permease subunit
MTSDDLGDQPQEQTAARRRTVRGLLVLSLGIGLFLVVVIVYFTVAASNFLTLSNIADILSGAAVLGIVAIGQSGVIISGGSDLSVAGVLPLACVLFVKFSNDGASLPAALTETLAVGAAVGIINAALIVQAGINPLIVTLASMSVAGGPPTPSPTGRRSRLPASRTATWATSRSAACRGTSSCSSG